jgi:dihydroorotate dehydrogenase
MTDLTTNITSGLTLRDPFMIASSHWTSTEQGFRALAAVRPSAVTLKTTSERKGGDGKSFAKRDKRHLQDYFRSPFAIYTDGPPTLELWDTVTTYEMTEIARKILPDSLLGLSILQGEDYAAIRQSLDLRNYGYVELNWKYAFRGISSAALETITRDVESFIEIFGTLPRIVKLSREAARYFELTEFRNILSILHTANTSLIVANSKRIRVPPSRVSGERPSELSKGVVIGEYLLLETYDLIRSLTELIPQGVRVPTLIGSGGVIDIAGLIDVIAGGASAIQLCTALDLRRVQVVELLREQLRTLAKDFGSFESLVTAIRSDPNKWHEVVIHSRDLDNYGQRIITRVLSDHALIAPLVKEAIINESTGSFMSVTEPIETWIAKPLNFIVTQGNVSSYLLSQHCIRELGFRAVLMESAADFRKALSREGFNYDLAIMPRSVLNYINKQPQETLGLKLPIEIGVVAHSITELVGDQSLKVDEVKEIYHFNGVTSRDAMSHLLKIMKPDTFELSGPDLLPLFRFWKPTSAILAKPPLSRIYPYLGHKELPEKWGLFWSTAEDLVLIASSELMNTEDGPKTAQRVLFSLTRIREHILQNPDQAVTDCINGGFLSYFAKLLGGDKVSIL